MNTSYFAKSGHHPKAVAIVEFAPRFYKGKVYPKLAPKPWFLRKYRKDRDEVFYTQYYCKEVLDKLDAKKVYEELGADAVLICWEGVGKFCHRHIVAKWLSAELGVEITEL